ncbi:MAG: SDR family NAD(P)-dependent oxidoreductase, partial [Chloroflexota bacterium]|nr:SDR family NAD(P)-dependent oxidoreductase [Chloroflexota bacterium]
AIRTAADKVQQTLRGANLFGLVNNAGVAVAGPLLHLPIDELRRQFEVNLFGLLAVTQAFAPLLGARKNAPKPCGRIVNISSVSGRIAYPFVGPYAMSKHALEALSDSLRRELLLYGVDVIVIGPGAVRTPIWDKAEQLDVHAYAATDYVPVLAKMQKTLVRQGQRGMPAQRVSAVIRTALESPRPKARYALPDRPISGWLLPRWLPVRWLDRLIGNFLGMKP